MNDRLPARLPPGSATQTQTQWYVVRLKDSGFGGPLNLETLKSAVETGTLAWTDIAYVETGAVGQWKRLFEIESLRAALPAFPDASRLKKFTERAGGTVAAPKLAAVPSPSAAAPAPSRGTPAPFAPAATVAPANGKPNTAWADALGPIAAKVPRAEWSSPRYWYLLLDGKEVGPIELAHVDAISRTARPPASAYGWHVSMKRWKPLGDIPELSKYVGKAAKPVDPDASLVLETAAQKRRSNRKSLVAAVFQLAGGKAEMIGVCGDVSPDGFQLLQHGRVIDYLPGTRLDLEIRVSKTGAVPPFRVSAVVKWFNPAKKIAGLEFIQLDAVDRKLLERFTSDMRK